MTCQRERSRILDYTIQTRLHEDVLEIEISGRGGAHNADEIAQDVFKVVRAAPAVKVLIDVRQFQGRMSMADTFFHVRRYPRDLPKVTTAVVDTKANKLFYSFFETTARNVGFSIRYFNDPPDALAWLQSERPT